MINTLFPSYMLIASLVNWIFLPRFCLLRIWYLASNPYWSPQKHNQLFGWHGFTLVQCSQSLNSSEIENEQRFCFRASCYIALAVYFSSLLWTPCPLFIFYYLFFLQKAFLFKKNNEILFVAMVSNAKNCKWTNFVC